MIFLDLIDCLSSLSGPFHLLFHRKLAWCGGLPRISFIFSTIDVREAISGRLRFKALVRKTQIILLWMRLWVYLTFAIWIFFVEALINLNVITLLVFNCLDAQIPKDVYQDNLNHVKQNRWNRPWYVEPFFFLSALVLSILPNAIYHIVAYETNYVYHKCRYVYNDHSLIK